MKKRQINLPPRAKDPTRAARAPGAPALEPHDSETAMRPKLGLKYG